MSAGDEYKLKTSEVFLGRLCFQDGTNSSRDSKTSSEHKAKRHLEREGLEVERRGKDRKHSHKRQRVNKKKQQRRPASTSSSPRSDFSQSDDSEEEMAVCPAERCQLPEGDEVRKVKPDLVRNGGLGSKTICSIHERVFCACRWTGSSVMAAATSGSTRCVSESHLRWPRRRTTFVSHAR